MKKNLNWYFHVEKLEKEIHSDGSVLYYDRVCVGGEDEEGEFMFVLDGPAEGEKVYL